MYDLMIIGGGPAGITACIDAARKRINAVLVTGDVGGQVNRTMGIENYLGYQFVEAPELIDKFHTKMSEYPMDQKIVEK
jgi:alkyl hydroperoxide reductase subunit F